MITIIIIIIIETRVGRVEVQYVEYFILFFQLILL